MSTTHLARNPNDKWVAGVCSGLARWVGWDPGAVRLLYLIGTIFSFGLGGVIAYVVLWAVMPEEEW